MRRSTPGVLGREELLPAAIVRAERHDPERVIAKLEPLVLERRRERLRGVIDRRVGSVAVCFDAPHDPHNGAAVIRSCEAFGVQYLHVIERDRPFLAATSVARGSEKWVDLVRHPTVSDTVSRLKSGGYTLVGTPPEGELEPDALTDIDAMMSAVFSGKPAIVRALVEAHAPINAMAANGDTMLYRALRRAGRGGRRDGPEGIEIACILHRAGANAASGTAGHSADAEARRLGFTGFAAWAAAHCESKETSR